MTVEQRLEALERELTRTKRRGRWLLFVVGLCVAVLALALAGVGGPRTAQAADEKVVVANKFILVDGNGKTRALLMMNIFGPALDLLDENGHHLVSLSVEREWSELSLKDEKGIPRASLENRGYGALSMLSKVGAMAANLSGSEEPSFSLIDKNQKTSVSLGAGTVGASLTLDDENLQIRTLFLANKDGTKFELFDADGKRRAALGVTKDGPQLALLDKYEKPFWMVHTWKQ